MPLVQIRRNPRFVDDSIIEAICETLPAIAARAFTAPEGTRLTSKDIVIEVDDVSSKDRNVKHLNVRCWAHDYPSRKGHELAALNDIRKIIANGIVRHLPSGVSWSVWVLLAPTSYSSDTEP